MSPPRSVTKQDKRNMSPEANRPNSILNDVLSDIFPNESPNKSKVGTPGTNNHSPTQK
jgi:hypothetical protein